MTTLRQNGRVGLKPINLIESASFCEYHHLPRPNNFPPFEHDKTHFFFPRLLIEHSVTTFESVGCGGSGEHPTQGDNS